MVMCSRCHKRAAVIFLHNPQMGNKPEGFCVKCARELGIKPVDDILAQSGLDDDTIERLNSDVQELIDNGEINPDETSSAAPLFNFSKLMGMRQRNPRRKPKSAIKTIKTQTRT